MNTDPIIILPDDLHTKKVEKRLAEYDALARNRAQAEMSAKTDALLIQTDAANRPSLWYNSIFTLTIFGILGGLLAWGFGEVALWLKPTEYSQAIRSVKDITDINNAFSQNKLTARQAQSVIRRIQRDSSDNAYLQVHFNDRLTLDQKKAEWSRLQAKDQRKEQIATALSYGISGLMIALFLAIAEPIIDRNHPRTIINGSIGAALGLLGGISVSFLVDRIYLTVSADTDSANMQLLARVASWGVLGLFLSIAPAIVMRNIRRFLIGMAGGLLGGLFGGALFDTVGVWTGDTHSGLIGRAVALVAIGAVAGGATGLIESAAKAGWLKVTAGLIAGKQFVLYRNPTYIGSGPECQIYLFKDPKVGRRHAAIHIVPAGFEIENLPLGEITRVNDRPIERQRLHHGDRIKIGASQLVFHEKTKA